MLYKIHKVMQGYESKADDIRGNFLKNLAGQLFLSNVAWALSHWEWVTHSDLDNLGWSWTMCLNW